MGSIFRFLAAVTELVAWIFQRRAKKADDPKAQHEKRYQRIDQDLSAKNGVKLTAGAESDLERLERLEREKKN